MDAECFDEHENDESHMPWQSQSPDLNPIEPLWEILERHLRQRFQTPSTKHQIMEFLMGMTPLAITVIVIEKVRLFLFLKAHENSEESASNRH